MPKFLKGQMLENYDVNTNEFIYEKNQILNLTELESFKDSYAVYHNLAEYNILDWIPKELIKVV